MLAQKLGLSLPTIKTVGAAAFENLYSLLFDGVNERLEIPNIAKYTPPGTDGFSVSFWVKTTSTRVGLIAKSNLNEYEWQIVTGSSGQIIWAIYSGGTFANGVQVIQTTGNTNDGNWHNVICSYDASNHNTAAGMDIFVDGVKYNDTLGNASWTQFGTFTGTVTNYANPIKAGGVYGQGRLTGNLDEIAIFNNLTTQAQATAIYNSGTPTDLSGENYLVGYFRNGDPTGTAAYPTIVDLSSNSNDGTMTNMVAADIVTDAP